GNIAATIAATKPQLRQLVAATEPQLPELVAAIEPQICIVTYYRAATKRQRVAATEPQHCGNLAANTPRTNVLTKFHEEVLTRINSPTPDIIKTNVLTKCSQDRTINEKCHTPYGGNVFQPIRSILELIQNINGTNFLTKFHEDGTINVTSRVLTRKHAPAPGGHVFVQVKFQKFHHFQTLNQSLSAIFF
ncbi:hypothetical protein DPMN_073250, partial [Dreissena polymorpha]